ncbi:3-oxoacyl-ACP synthase [Candidatus Aerophobetes bacterium]|uniref:Beta-ketoacyl-[acyl-carrier-protein] synthase III n=1 Tax=Aerophobetes bacterium TaxID=2030807 RepID=A0A2A4YLW9_UNCAE|nr:MAG: 3-oxoacyl-ACP synthase [Candidatus Aerophobetes bacterium]
MTTAAEKVQARITGTGSYLPEKILTNADLEKIVDTNDEWIVSRTGMKERRIASDDETNSYMGTEAAKVALKEASLSVDDIDLILFATVTPDYMFPSTACLVQKNLKATNAAAFDMQATCSGYIYALATAKAYIESGLYRNILVIASDKLSSFIDYSDRSTCILFGDGAASCVVSGSGKGLLISNAALGADGSLSDIIKVPAGGSRKPASIETVEAKEHYIKMEGREVYKHAVRRMEAASLESLRQVGITESDISYLIPHQANLRIIEGLAKRFQIGKEKVYVTIHKYGNTSASSCGIALHELMNEKKLDLGKRILLVAFGSGLTWGASVLTVTDK